MSNFSVGPDTIVPEIRRLLRESYVIEQSRNDILPIVKELLQNANDARATEFELRFYRRGLPRAEVKNELLADPAIVCLNNGEFREHHAAALDSMSVTSKTTDTTAIGRFGLGQKAVFHLSEVFLALGRSPGSPNRPLCKNPWAAVTGHDVFKRPWDGFDAAEQAHVEALVHAPWREREAWFALWLPVRRRDRDTRGTLSPWFPEVAELAQVLFQDPFRVASLLPQLSRVKRIRFLLCPAPGAPAERALDISIEEGEGLSVPRSAPAVDSGACGSPRKRVSARPSSLPSCRSLRSRPRRSLNGVRTVRALARSRASARIQKQNKVGRTQESNLPRTALAARHRS